MGPSSSASGWPPRQCGRGALALEDALQRLLQAAEPDRLVEAAVACLARWPAARPVARLADRLDVSERQLHRRFTAAVGYGPKTLHRVLRFRRFLSLAAASPAALAELAVLAGYADQAHLSRETQRLAEASPGSLVRA